MRRTIAVILALGLVVAACDGDGGDSTSSPEGSASGSETSSATSGSDSITAVAEAFDPSSIRFEAALERFDSCDALLDHFKAEAKERVTAWGLEGGGPWFPVFEEGMVEGEGAFEGGDDMAEVVTTAAMAESPQAGADYSDTNVQVAGVDEPDIVKTDGRRIVVVVENKLHVVGVDGGRAELLGSLRLDAGWNHRLFVVGERAYLFSSGDGPIAMPTDVSIESSLIPPPYPGPSTVISEVDLSDPEDMEVTRSLTIEGQYLSARAVDGTVRVVVSSYPGDLPFVYPSSAAAEETALDANRRAIDSSTLEDWLPEFTLVDGDGDVENGLLIACDRTHHPVEFAGFDTLSVLTFDADEGLSAGGASAVVADGETVYASTEALYVATNVWIPETLAGDSSLDVLEESYSTSIHKFDIRGDGPAEYVASGSVEGHLLNQFSMDEYDGYLRIATTRGTPWSFEEDSESFIAVLEQQGDRLEPVGLVGDMGEGERIFSVRFVADTAYVVTFRQTDPLYVVDLRNPREPEVAGELKIPGYSAYLHPIGEGRILGVGQDATEEGFTTGAKVSLFDVSDPADPVELSTWVMEDSYTEVEWDHLAFLYWPADDLVVLPMQNWSTGFTGAVVLSTEDGLREVGKISHELDESGPPSECTQYFPEEDFWEPGLIVQVCGENDWSAVPGHYCEVLPSEEAEWISDEFLGSGIDLSAEVGSDEHIELCWPDYEEWNPIQRSLVIGEALWTLSWRALQSNAIDGLDILDQIPLG